MQLVLAFPKYDGNLKATLTISGSRRSKYSNSGEQQLKTGDSSGKIREPCVECKWRMDVHPSRHDTWLCPLINQPSSLSHYWYRHYRIISLSIHHDSCYLCNWQLLISSVRVGCVKFLTNKCFYETLCQSLTIGFFNLSNLWRIRREMSFLKWPNSQMSYATFFSEKYLMTKISRSFAQSELPHQGILQHAER